MSVPFVNRTIAWQMYRANRPFKVRLTYDGYTDNGNRSDKWWSLEFDGIKGHSIKCNHGAAGANGRKVPFEYTMAKADEKCREKVKKGYDYVGSTRTSMPTAPQPVQIKLEGVFADIRKLVEIAADHFEAYDGGDHFLFDLPESGALQVASADSIRIRVVRL
jgi:predicted DNA-binding WGR domain protein